MERYKDIYKRTIALLASSHIAGPTLLDAIEISRRAAMLGWASTLCPWSCPNESLTQRRSKYFETLHAIATNGFDSELSLKAPDLEFDVGCITEIVQCAAAKNIHVMFDAHAPESVEPTFQIIERVRALHPLIGCTLPSRWKRSEEDAERAVALQLRVRVVRGQWKDSITPAQESQKSFLELVDLLAHRAIHVTVATHRHTLAIEALKRLQEAGTPCELEQMFGLPLIGFRALQRLKVNKRLYIPYGSAGLPYNASDILRRPAIAAWVLRDIILGRSGKLAYFS